MSLETLLSEEIRLKSAERGVSNCTAALKPGCLKRMAGGFRNTLCPCGRLETHHLDSAK